MTKNTFNHALHFSLIALGGFFLVLGTMFLTGWWDAWLSQFIAEAAKRQVSPNWPGYFRVVGVILLGLGSLLIFSRQVAGGLGRLGGWARARVESTDRWLYQKSKGVLHLTGTEIFDWPLKFNRWDAVIILFFILIAFIYQISVFGPAFPTVILGGDAANIASFAAGRAYPEHFKSDAILGDLNNIGLYVTVHLPIAIWLEKLVGNFGLAYSLLLFPHVFLQYFSYYLLGRVLFRNRYWAFLFSLAVSVPLTLDGGEVWGVVSDAMPRFTFQVLIPLVLILLLAAWREKRERWPWIMVMAGLMAFIHPVSTPTWAFALWLGFWPMLPHAWETRHKLLEMFKLGVVLALSLLPYVSIYLTYHQGGGGGADYDLVYLILTKYFPYNLLNIPAAVQTLVQNTAQIGLFWYGLGGLLLTALLFRGERSRLRQMLVWIAGIVFVTILVPWVETTIERTFRLIPLQTELMRGMRYLVPFLFIFWFYPLAQSTLRAARITLTRSVYTVGTLLTLLLMLQNPPAPLASAPYVLDCWRQGQLICSGQDDYAEALNHVRSDTPEGSKFIVFLTNRWSGIEVRYLGLRPMVYAYKDRGQLAFTNLEALELWYYYLQRENVVFSRNISPTLDDKRVRMVDFARDAGADYILTDFPFPQEVQLQLEVTAIYQNGTFSILKSYPIYR